MKLAKRVLHYVLSIAVTKKQKLNMNIFSFFAIKIKKSPNYQNEVNQLDKMNPETLSLIMTQSI